VPGVTKVATGLDGGKHEWVNIAAFLGEMAPRIDKSFEETDSGAEIVLLHIKDTEALVKAIVAVQAIIKSPLMIQPDCPAAAEAGLRVINGRPLIKLTDPETASEIKNIAKKYGAIIYEYYDRH
jgi:5-methyltetrahydrofolate--homocysteine methyltransferase